MPDSRSCSITAGELAAVSTAVVALDDVARLCEGWSPVEIGIDPAAAGATLEAARLRAAGRVLHELRRRITESPEAID